MDELALRDHHIAFRPLAQGDLPNIQRWLSDPGVVAWWRQSNLSLEAMIGKYVPIIEGSEPVRAFVIAVDGHDVGYIQAYVLGDHPGYQQQVDVDPAAVGVDLFIGEADYRDRGWGTAATRLFLERIVFGEMAADLAMIAPEPANARAIRVYERVGFRWVKTVAIIDKVDPQIITHEYVMLLRNPNDPGNP